MDEEVEDIVGEVKYTDSQKSVTTSANYSLDFTDSSSDKNNSYGKDTYVLACDSDDSDKTFQLHKSESIINLINTTNTLNAQDLKNGRVDTVNRSASTNLHKRKVEIFTQTSKTIMELAQTDLQINKHTNNLETQTSIISFTENKTFQYTVQVVDTKCKYNKQIKCSDQEMRNIAQNTTFNNIQTLQDGSSEFHDSEKACDDVSRRSNGSDQESIHFIGDESKENLLCNQKDNDSRYDSTEFDSDIEDDSLENTYQKKRDSKANDSDTSEVPNSIDNDVEELYNKLSKSPLVLSPIQSIEPIVRNIGILTPLTEETAYKKDSIVLSPSEQTLTQNMDEETLFINNGVRIKMFPNFPNDVEDNILKLPPIINQSFPHNPNLNFIFSLQNHKDHLNANERQNGKYNRWEICDKELASGESHLITGRSDSLQLSKDPLRLPPIHLEGYFCNAIASNRSNIITPKAQTSCKESVDVISIDGKIKELKLSAKRSRRKYDNRSLSPSISSPEDSRISDATERGCDALCCELLRKLRSSEWTEVTETLEDLPKALEKFWAVISENRIADLLRIVTGHIESPRTQVARCACNTLAEILKNTNYTKKPDFYEGISSLLTKTGSYNRPVRRAANVALDEIVCKVDVTHAVTAICIYGVGHKNALVRSASARLLVVCCALAEGGRQILRARPPTAVAARKHALRSLAELLQDKSTETRKYAERLYAMLRPLQSFEAYFLTDVDVELASRHMKKYDQLLFGNKQNR